MKRLMGIMLVFVLVGIGCVESRRVSVIKQDLLYFRPGEGKDYVVGDDGERVLVAEFERRKLMKGKVVKAKTVNEKSGRELLVRVDGVIEDGAEGVIYGLMGLERMGIEMGEMRVEVLRGDWAIEGIRFAGVKGEVLEDGVAF